MTDKEHKELLNLRKRVEAQRTEIKCLSEQLERQKEYAKRLEEFIQFIIDGNDTLKQTFRELTQTA